MLVDLLPFVVVVRVQLPVWSRDRLRSLIGFESKLNPWMRMNSLPSLCQGVGPLINCAAILL